MNHNFPQGAGYLQFFVYQPLCWIIYLFFTSLVLVLRAVCFIMNTNIQHLVEEQHENKTFCKHWGIYTC